MVKTIGSDQLKIKKYSKNRKFEGWERYCFLFERAIDAIYIYELLPNGNPGHFLEVNQSMCHRLGYSKEELLQTSLYTIGRPDENKAKIQEALQQLKTMGCISFETVHVAKNGEKIPVEVNSRLIELENKRIILSLARDLTESKRVENVLIAKNHELDQFAYIVSHDLKAPLRAIHNLSEWIEEDLGEQVSDEIRTNMDLLRGRVKRMENLIQGILEYSRVGGEKGIATQCDIGQLLGEIILDLNPPSQFTVEIVGEMPILLTHDIKLRQVFTNLISNGIKHHQRMDGHIQISVEDVGAFYKFIVRDNGPGIEAANHQKIFNIFHVLQPRDQKENTGIGLAIVKKIVEDQSGEIIVTSQQGQGATFSFTWAKG